MKKVLSIFILVVVVLVLLAQIDDDLSEQATTLVDRLEEGAESESYLYLFGFFAKEGDSPKLIGKKLLEEYQKSYSRDSYEAIAYPESEKLPLPIGEAFCRSWEDNCLEYLFSSEINTEALLSENKTLVVRSNTFLEFKEYKTLSDPTVNEIYPPYQYLAAAERIKVLEAVSVYKGGDARKAIASLLEQFSKLRKAMELQDNLVGKLVLLMKLSEIIDVVSVILSNANLEVESIPSLNQSEKDFYMIAAREFGLSYHTFKDLDMNPEFFEMGGNFPGWITRMTYKPNMTINAVAPIYYQLEKLAQMSPSDLATYIDTERDFIPSTSKLRNYVGGVLISNSPEFDKYVAKFSDLEAKLALFNQLHHLKQDLGSMGNPYYGNETPKEIDGSLCFSGPLDDKRSLRCLRIKI